MIKNEFDDLDEYEIDDYDDYEDENSHEGLVEGIGEDGRSAFYNPNYYYEDEHGIMMARGREEEKKPVSAKHYVRMGTSTFGFVDDVVDEIPSGFYRPNWDGYNQKAFLEKREVVTPKLYHLPDEVFETIINDITHFWESRDKYEAFGNVYKRNILLHSVAGNGKTSLINLLAAMLIEKHNGIIMSINSIPDLIAYPKCLERMRQIEPDRPIITIIEDFDGIVGQDKSAETMLLQILDGNQQYSNVVTIATTNYIEQLKPSFTNRPSRFNLILEYKKPNEKVRRFYFTNKLQDSGFDVSSEEVINSIERLVKGSEGFTFDYCKELLELIYVMEYSEEDAFKRVNEASKKKGKYTNTEEKANSVGFVTETATGQPTPPSDRKIGFL